MNQEYSIPESLENFDSLPDLAIVRQPVVKALVGCSNATIWRMVKDGRLPEPVRRGRITGWRVGALRNALAA